MTGLDHEHVIVIAPGALPTACTDSTTCGEALGRIEAADAGQKNKKNGRRACTSKVQVVEPLGPQ